MTERIAPLFRQPLAKDEVCMYLAENCNHVSTCYFDNCPFNLKCEEVTAEDWAELIDYLTGKKVDHE